MSGLCKARAAADLFKHFCSPKSGPSSALVGDLAFKKTTTKKNTTTTNTPLPALQSDGAAPLPPTTTTNHHHQEMLGNSSTRTETTGKRAKGPENRCLLGSLPPPPHDKNIPTEAHFPDKKAIIIIKKKSPQKTFKYFVM